LTVKVMRKGRDIEMRFWGAAPGPGYIANVRRATERFLWVAPSGEGSKPRTP